MVVDLTSHEESESQTVEERMEYLMAISNITKGFAFHSVN